MAAEVPILHPREAAERLLANVVRPARLLIAVSGGSDSVGLLLSLVEANSSVSEVSIDAVTIDHALRPESADEALSVAALCRRLGVRHFIRRWEGEKPRTGISAASRDARYRLLIDVAGEIGATAILTGHTLDDQAETVAMRAARDQGEGNLGLAGMAGAVLLDRRLWLLRPFLDVRRADIRAFLSKAGEGWIDDPSNFNIRYERVRVRERLSEQNRFDREVNARAGARRTELSDAAAQWVRAHLTIRQGVLAYIKPEGLSGDPAVRRHALSVLAAILGGRSYMPGRDTMDRVMGFIDGGQPGRITAGRVIFDLRRGGLYVVRENRGMMPLHVAPGCEATWDGRYLVENMGYDEIVVGPTAPDRHEAVELFADVPPAIAMRAAAAMPRFGVASSAIHVRPMLGPFDRFLPQFDVNLAGEFAVLLGCDVFPPMPVKDCARKS